MLKRITRHCHIIDLFGARFICCWLIVVLPACSELPVHGRQFTGASPIRHTQQFETALLNNSPESCVVRTKLPEQRQPGSWIDERNSALGAALAEAHHCCSNPRLVLVEDWMVGFTPYQATFQCDTHTAAFPGTL